MRSRFWRCAGGWLLALALSLSPLPPEALAAEEAENVEAAEAAEAVEFPAEMPEADTGGTEEAPEVPAPGEAEAPEVPAPEEQAPEEPEATGEEANAPPVPQAAEDRPPDNPPVLNLGGSLELPVTPGEPVYIALKAAAPSLCSISAGGTPGWFNRWNPKTNDWDRHDIDAPVYADPRGNQYMKFTPKANPAGTSATISLTEFTPVQQLEEGWSTTLTGTSTTSVADMFYLQFDPSSSDTYQISVVEGERLSDNTWISFDIWDPEANVWADETPVRNGYQVLSFSCEEGVPRFFRFEFIRQTSATVDFTKLAPSDTDLSVTSEPMQMEVTPFSASVNAIVRAPLGHQFRVGIEYRVNGLPEEGYYSNRSGISHNPYVLQTEWLCWGVLPGAEYEYRAYIEQFAPDSFAITRRAEEQEWKKFQAPPVQETRLSLGTPVSSDSLTSSHYHLLSFTPPRDGQYTFSLSGEGSGRGELHFWEADTGSWDLSNGTTSDTSRTLSLTAGTPQYIQFQPGSVPCEITVTEFTPVTAASVKLETPRVSDFSAIVPATATIPLNVRYRYWLKYTYESTSSGSGSGETAVSVISSSDSQTVHLNSYENIFVLPSATYTFRMCMQRLDGEGEPIYSEPVTFQTNEDTASQELFLNVSEPVTDTGYPRGYFRFTPQESRQYQITAAYDNTDQSTNLSVYDPKTGKANPYSSFTGTTTLVFDGVSGITRYFQFYRPQQAVNCTLTIEPFTPTVDKPAAEAGPVEELVSGFLYRIPITVKAPIGSSFWLGMECQYPDRTRVERIRSYSDTGAEVLYNSDTLYTLPNRPYSYRAILTTVNPEASTPADRIYEGPWTDFTSGPNGAMPLKIGEPLYSSTADTRFYSFTPETTGDYSFKVSGKISSWDWADSTSTGWRERRVDGIPVILPLQAGTAQYIRIGLGASTNDSFSLEATPCEPVKLGRPLTTPGNGVGASYAFVPEKTGPYRFCVKGSSGTLTVLLGDGTREQLPYDSETAELELQLQEGETVYLVHQENGSGSSTLTAAYQPLSAFRSSQGSGVVTAVLESPAKDTDYLFAAYDGAGRLLAVQIKSVYSTEDLSVSLNAGTSAQTVKVFRVDLQRSPLEPVKTARVRTGPS